MEKLSEAGKLLIKMYLRDLKAVKTDEELHKFLAVKALAWNMTSELMKIKGASK